MADYVKMWTPDEGQTFIDGDYTYTVQANSTLSVKVTSTDKATYGQIKNELIINGETYTTTSMDGCFEGCSNLTTAPIIPAGITLMQSCFKGCTKLSGNIVALNSTISSYTDIFTNTDVARKIFIVHSTEVPDTSADIVVWQTIAGNFSNVYYKAESNPDPTNEVRVERGTYDENEGKWKGDDTEDDIKVTITAGLSTEFLPINWTNEIKSYSVTFDNAPVALVDAQINEATVTGYILNEENAGTIRTTVTDSYNRTSNEATAEVYNIFVMLDFYPGGEGMAIGKASERNGLDITIPTTIGEGLKPPTKIENGKEVVDLTKYQLTIGKYNKKNDNAFLIVGGGENDNNRRNVLELDSAGLRLYAYGGDAQLANIGYGEGQAASGTDIAPYYTLGIRKTTNSQYNENATYNIGDICIYGEKIYICVTSISIPEPWTSIHWRNYLGNYSIAEGNDTIASGYESHAEGASTKAMGNASHAEGYNTLAKGTFSHVEGDSAEAGNTAHAEGKNTEASGNFSHAQNLGTIAQRRSQTTIGEYNITDTGGSSIATKGDYAFIIGNGNGILNDPDERSNALTVDWSGNVWCAGGIATKSINVTNGITANTLLINNTATFKDAVRLQSDKSLYLNDGITGFDSNVIYSSTWNNTSNLYIKADGYIAFYVGDASTAPAGRTYVNYSGVTVSGTISSGGAITSGGTITSSAHIYMPNASYLCGKNTSGDNRIVAGINGSNGYLFGYDGYYRNEGTSYFDGNNVQIRSKNEVYIAVKDPNTHVMTNGYLSAPGTYAQTTTASANMYVWNGGKIGRSTASSKKYKTDIQLLSKTDIEAELLYKIPVVEFKYKDGYITDETDKRLNKKVPGFIAEDIAEIYPIAAEYIDDNPEDWSVRYIVPPMLKLIQEQHEEIEQLKKEVQELKNK